MGPHPPRAALRPDGRDRTGRDVRAHSLGEMAGAPWKQRFSNPAARLSLPVGVSLAHSASGRFFGPANPRGPLTRFWPRLGAVGIDPLAGRFVAGATGL